MGHSFLRCAARHCGTRQVVQELVDAQWLAGEDLPRLRGTGERGHCGGTRLCTEIVCEWEKLSMTVGAKQEAGADPGPLPFIAHVLTFSILFMVTYTVFSGLPKWQDVRKMVVSMM